MSTQHPHPDASGGDQPTERISATRAADNDEGRDGPDHRARVEPDGGNGAADFRAEERRRFGGVKIGSAFFGWLTAMGMSVLLTALLAAAGAGIGLANGSSAEDLVNQASKNMEGVGVASAIALGIILLVAYYCGGYVAGRMARFNGIRQGVAVWVWAIVIALVLAGIGAIAGSQFNVLGSLNILPRVPLDEGALGAGGIVALVIAVLVPLVGAILGGLAGMRYHRRIDRAVV
ncbi:hypothetical protein [Arthrobacter sp. JSM 101049]|uniref:hypothetical protein n=1 Tax=Arthrobacter sp. JSM 101049 TaxID=929097 RepID=UPI003562C2D5